MKDFNCEALQLNFWFSLDEMDQDAFLKALGIENKEEHTDEDGDIGIALSFTARDETTDYHAHVSTWFFKDGRNKIEISYHDSKTERTDNEPPFVEDCTQWLANFFNVDKVTARRSASFTFGKSYSSVVNLPFPLISTEKALTGTLVTGLSILFLKETPETAILQTSPDDETMLFFNTSSDLNLREFNLFKELERLSPSIDSLVKKRENSGENRKDNK